MSTYDQFGAKYIRLTSAANPPTTGQYGPELLRPIKDDGTDFNFAADWSTYPATSNVDMAGLDLTNAGTVVANNYFGVIDPDTTPAFTQYGVNEIVSSSTASYLSIAPNPSFGINNGEPAGVGSDINLTSANGSIRLTSQNGVNYFNGKSTSTFCYFANNDTIIGDAYINIGNPTTYASCNIGSKSDGTVFIYSVIGGMLEVGDGNGEGMLPMRAASGYFGATTDDGSGALIQSAGIISAALNYVSGGQSGVDGTFLDGSGGTVTVTGGIITGIP